jgi:hypothetical protein
MHGIGNAHFAPEEIELLREALDEAWARLDGQEQLQICKSELAEHILKLAGNGERDRVQLRDFALQRARERAVWLDLAS